MRPANQSSEWARAVSGFIVVAWLLVVLAGCCESALRRPQGSTKIDVDFDPDAVWAEVRRAQDARLGALGTLSSAGTAIIRGEMDGAVRSEQVELRLWWLAPSRAAFRVSKLGASFQFLGWNGDRWWALDESGKEPVLRVQSLSEFRMGNLDETLFPPPLLLGLLGVMSWPEDTPEGLEAIRVDDEGRVVGVRFELPDFAWATSDGFDLGIRSGIRVEVDRFDQGPSRIWWIEPDGSTRIESSLSRLESVETRGLPPGAWPMLPHRVKMRSATGDEISISLDVPLAGGEISERLFDLDALRKRHPDAIVIETVPSGPRTQDGDAG